MDNADLTTYRIDFERVQKLNFLVTAPDEDTAIYAAYNSLTDSPDWNPTTYGNFSATKTTPTEAVAVWTKRSIDNYYFDKDADGALETRNRLMGIVNRIKRGDGI
jgi:hypothetical protein